MTGFFPDQAGVEVRVSPNFGSRREGKSPSIIVLHYTGMETGEGAEAWLADPASEVSAHYVVHEDGQIVQMVREADRAWHAGKSFWAGETDINSISVGIEIVNPGHTLGYTDFPDPQISAVIALCSGIATRHRIRPECVLAHSDVAPGRKVDPGEKFPWALLAEAEIGLWVEPGFVTGGGGFGEGARAAGAGAASHAVALRIRLSGNGSFRRAHARGGRGVPAAFPPGIGQWRSRCLDARYACPADRRAARRRGVGVTARHAK